MISNNLKDTIVAIATAQGESGIGIVRLSGSKALEIADKIFNAKSGQKVPELKSHTVNYGWIKDGIDEVLLTVMRAPRTYTREDIVEINCHGGIVALRKVLELVLENGARLAEPGEFTKRAFLSGRIDLAQAEAVLDIIRSKSDSALDLAVGQLKGRLSREINLIRTDLLEALAILEAGIDFPDEEDTGVQAGTVTRKLNQAAMKIKELLDNSKQAMVLREGLHVVICGKPNAGKSSLLNALLKQERSIVTPVAGTTRDTIEEIIDIRGIPVRIVDTAGILEPRDLVEKKAVFRSKEEIRRADLVIVVFDGSRKLSKEDMFLIRKLKSKKAIAVINKIDLKQKIENKKLEGLFEPVIGISAKKSKNINLLEDCIAQLVFRGKVFSKEHAYISNLRHLTTLRETQKLVAEAKGSLDNRLPPELTAQAVKDALLFLDKISGKVYQDDLLDKIFSEFCIGK